VLGSKKERFFYFKEDVSMNNEDHVEEDFGMVMRAGRRNMEVVDSEQGLPNWLFWLLTLAALTIFWIVIFSLIFAAPARAEVWDAEAIADAIYLAEGGEMAKRPFGVLSVKCDGYRECRQVCLNTVQNNFTRWQVAGAQGDYLEFLARRYAPIGAENDPQGLNRHWLKNVRYFLTKVN
jgi:hypothetical protein